MRTYNTIELCATNWYWFILRTISAMLRLFQHFLFRCYLPKCASIFFCIFEIQRKFHGNLNIPKCSFFRPKYNRNEKFFSQKVFIRNSISSYLQLDLCTRLKTTILCMAENFAIDLEEPLPVILCRLWTF